MNKTTMRRLAVTVRQELDLTVHDPFDPLALADLYGIAVLRLSEIGCSSSALAHFQVARPEVFSGALVPLSDGSTVIVENDCHSHERRTSTACHELAHVLLEHPFAATLTDTRGCRLSSPAHEAEAAELSGELLIPTDAARRLAYNKISDEEAAARFGVSPEFARWRLNATGARRIASRAHAKRGA